VSQTADALVRRAKRVIPGGHNSTRRNLDPPFVVRRAVGARVYDSDGQEYIDYQGGAGTVVLGHSHPIVVERVAAAAKGLILPAIGVTEPEVELAERIVEYVPSIEQVLMCNTGSEATQNAVRLARAVTGRVRVIKFQGHYHGHHDHLLRNCQSRPEMIGRRDPHSAGMLDAAIDAVVVCPYNDLSAVEAAFDAHDGEIAAVIIEPISHNGPGIIPRPGFLEGLRKLCDQHGTILIFDEIISGFRHSLGGYQSICGVMPDLTALGKAIANGFTLAGVGGRTALMERFNTKEGGDVFWCGTHNGNQVSVAAALATIDLLADGSVHEHIARLGDMMREGLQAIIKNAPVPACVCGFGSLFTLIWASGPIDSYDDVARNDLQTFVTYRRELIARGVFEFPDIDGMRSCISAAHTEADIEKSLTIADQAFQAAIRGNGR
jgi:glutamate-1-semialdehyde 2,1-aminomutase